MKLLQANDSLVLLPEQALSFRSQTALWLRLDIGRVWITAANSPTDYWLQAGQSIVLEANQHLVFEANEFSRLDALPLNHQQKLARLDGVQLTFAN